MTVTDMDHQNPFVVERHVPPPAMDAPDELLSSEMQRVAEHNSFAKLRYRTLKAKYQEEFRINLVNPEVAGLAKEINRGQAEHVAKKRAETSGLNRLAGVSADLGVSLPRSASRNESKIKAAEDLQTLLHQVKGES